MRYTVGTLWKAIVSLSAAFLLSICTLWEVITMKKWIGIILIVLLILAGFLFWHSHTKDKQEFIPLDQYNERMDEILQDD